MRRRTILACALPGGASPTQEAGGQPVPGETQPSGNQPTAEPTTAIPPTETPVPTPIATPPPLLPIGIRQGLASLNSYQIKFVQVLDGPGPQDKNHTTTEMSVSSQDDRSHTRITALNSSADSPSSEPHTTDRYQAGSQVCSLPASEEGKSPLTSSNPVQEEMANAMSSQMDITLYADNPVLLGEEQVNGVQSRHYQFKVSGLGKKSGAEVTQSSGEYWSAVDGNYLVKYHLILETRSAPQGDATAQVMHSEITYELCGINQPVSIEMPPECK